MMTKKKQEEALKVKPTMLTGEEIDCIQKFLLRVQLTGNEAATFIVCQQKLGKLKAELEEG